MESKPKSKTAKITNKRKSFFPILPYRSKLPINRTSSLYQKSENRISPFLEALASETAMIEAFLYDMELSMDTRAIAPPVNEATQECRMQCKFEILKHSGNDPGSLRQAKKIRRASAQGVSDPG